MESLVVKTSLGDVKVTICSAEEAIVWDDYSYQDAFQILSGYYIIDSLNQYVWFHTRELSKARLASDELYGKGKYTVRNARQSKSGSGEYSARGSNTLKGFSSRLKKS